MFAYQSRRRPRITRDDLANVTMLLGCFDEVTFNGDGEIVATLTVDMPVLGKIIISLFDRENHIQLQRPDDDKNGILGGIWSGYIYDIDHDFEGTYDRDRLIAAVKNVLRDEIAKQLV